MPNKGDSEKKKAEDSAVKAMTDPMLAIEEKYDEEKSFTKAAPDGELSLYKVSESDD